MPPYFPYTCTPSFKNHWEHSVATLFDPSPFRRCLQIPVPDLLFQCAAAVFFGWFFSIQRFLISIPSSLGPQVDFRFSSPLPSSFLSLFPPWLSWLSPQMPLPPQLPFPRYRSNVSFNWILSSLSQFFESLHCLFSFFLSSMCFLSFSLHE